MKGKKLYETPAIQILQLDQQTGLLTASSTDIELDDVSRESYGEPIIETWN
ncbi:MAG: hypothetical protein IKY01_11175 [Prevotella sp.]|nr:hypothetical protein [Prevotella sp.]